MKGCLSEASVTQLCPRRAFTVDAANRFISPTMETVMEEGETVTYPPCPPGLEDCN